MKIEWGQEKLYCPVCQRVLERRIGKEVEFNFKCYYCEIEWLIVDSDGVAVLSSPTGGTAFTREPLTEAEKRWVEKKKPDSSHTLKSGVSSETIL